MAKTITEVPDEWQQLFACLAFLLIVPLVPLGLEKWLSGQIEVKSLLLTAAMFAFAIATAHLHKPMIFALGLVETLVFSVAFGFASKEPSIWHADHIAWGGIALMFLLAIQVRYNQHVVLCEPFLPAAGKQPGAAAAQQTGAKP